MAEFVGQIKAEMVSRAPNTAPSAPQSPLPSLPLGIGLGFAFVGRSPSGGASSAAQYDVAANPTLTNGTLDAMQGWTTQGSVSIVDGAAVLTEVSGSQTRLSQIFMVGAQDRYLSFTLGSTVLDNQAIGPDDAFEAALLDANTGVSLAGRSI